MTGEHPLRIQADAASCSHVGSRLIAGAARLAELDAHPALRADLDALGRALQRYAVRMTEVSREAGEVQDGLDAAGLRLRGRHVEPGRGPRDAGRADPRTDLAPGHAEAVRHVARRAARARRRLQLAALAVS